MTDSDLDYLGSAGTFVDEIEIYDMDDYIALFGELPITGLEDSEPDDVND
jgi:hypothetical protein